jgi:diguanylate cyclase (GGDEF)-like protein
VIPSLSIKTKLIMILSSVLIIAFVGISIANYMVSRGSLRTRVLDETLPLISDNIYSEIQKDLMRPIDVSSLMANDTFLKDWTINGEKNIGKITKYLKEIKERYGFFTAFFVSDKSRMYYHHKGLFKMISALDAHDIWYFIFKNKNMPFVLDVDSNEAEKGALTVFINHRLEDNEGNLLGVTGVGLNMNSIGATLRSYEREYNLKVYMVDAKGLIQIHPDPNMIEKLNISRPDWFGDLGMKLLVKSGESTSHQLMIQDRPILISSRYIPRFNWFLIVEQDEMTVLKDIRAAMYSNLLAGLVVTIFIIIIVVVAVNHFQGKLERLAVTDELTGLHNRRHFLQRLEREALRSERYGHQISLLMIDVDHFKSINDNHGHQAGDVALKLLARTMNGSLRQVDSLGRLGGEEFGALLPETSRDKAVEIAERIRLAVESNPLKLPGQSLTLTVSIGVASYDQNAAGPEEMLKSADSSMYEAKKQGRNRVCVAHPQEAA